MKITEKDIAELERINLILKATIEKQRANIDYVAMMSDINIPTEENESGT